MPFFREACQWGITAISAFGGALRTIADLSVRGIKRAFEHPPTEVIVTRIIADTTTQTRAIEERSEESENGSVKRRRLDDLARPIPSNTTRHAPFILRRAPNPRVPKDAQRYIASTDYTAGITWEWTPDPAEVLREEKRVQEEEKRVQEEESRVQEEVRREAIRAAKFAQQKFDVRLPGSHYTTQYDLVDRPAQITYGPVRRAHQLRFGKQHPYKMSDAEKQKAKADKIAKQEKLDYAARQKQYAAEAAICRERNRKAQKAMEDAEEQARLDEEEEAIKHVRREARDRRQREAARRRAGKKNGHEKMWSERTATLDEKDEEEVDAERAGMVNEKDSGDETANGRSGSQISMFEQYMNRHPGAPYMTTQAYELASGSAGVPVMDASAFAPESAEVPTPVSNPDALATESQVPVMHSPGSTRIRQEVWSPQTYQNTRANEQSNAQAFDHLTPVAKPTTKEVRFGISPYSGLDLVNYKTYDKSAPPKELESPQGKWPRDLFLVRPFDDLLRKEGNEHPASVSTRDCYGLGPQYDDPFVVEPGDTVMPDVSPQTVSITSAANRTSTHSHGVLSNASESSGSSQHVHPTPSATTNGDVATTSSATALADELNNGFSYSAAAPLDSRTPADDLQNGVSHSVPASLDSHTPADDYKNVVSHSFPAPLDSETPADDYKNVVSHSVPAPLDSETPIQSTPPPESTESGKSALVHRPISNASEDLEDEVETLDLYKKKYKISGSSLHRVVTIRENKRQIREQEAARKKAEEEKAAAIAAAAKAKAEADAAAAKLKAEKEAKDKADAEAKLAAEAEAAKNKRCMPDYKFVGDLDPTWERRLADVLKLGNEAPVCNTPAGNTLRGHDFKTVLQNGRWLNDEIINAHLEQTVKEANEIAGMTKYVCQNSFFYSTIAEKGPEKVARWMKRKKAGGKDMLNLEAVFIPVNSSSHWTLIVVCPKMKTIEYLDSLGYDPAEKIRNTRRWLAQELGDAYVASEWTVPNTACAEQRNGFDCGVFTITNAKCISMGYDPTCYSAADMAMQRKRIAAELIQGHSLD